MIKSLVNNRWKYFTEDQLKPGTEIFKIESSLYETFMTIEHQPVFLKEHLDRLFFCVKKINLKIKINRKIIKKMIEKVIKNLPYPNQRCRILLTQNQIIVYSTPLGIDNTINKGVSAISIPMKRETPYIRTTNYSECLNEYKIAQKNNCFDTILCDDDNTVLAVSRSNVFWVKNHHLFTRMKDVLPGITRKKVISKSPIKIYNGKLNLFDFNSIDEVFLTNSGSGIIPVIKVNNITIGHGNVGLITSKLLKLYDVWLKNEI